MKKGINSGDSVCLSEGRNKCSEFKVLNVSLSWDFMPCGVLLAVVISAAICTEVLVSKTPFQTGEFSNEFLVFYKDSLLVWEYCFCRVTLMNTPQALCSSQTYNHTPKSDLGSSIGTKATSPTREWGGKKQYDNSECPAVIMVFMKRWNWVQTKSVAAGKINSLALLRDPCLSWGYSKHTKTLQFFFISQEWGNEVHRLLVIIN